MNVRSLVPLVSLFALGTAGTACKKQDPTPSHEGSAATVGSGGGGLAPEPVAEHGDHNARHGGAILMDERGHMELVFKDDGAVEVWLTDGMRKAVPASTASTLALTVTRPGQAAEVIALAPDSADVAWTGTTKPLTDPEAKLHFTYNAAGKSAPYQIDLTLKQLREMQAAVEPGHQGGDGHTDHDHGAAATSVPASLKDAVAQLDTAFQELAAVVKDGDLSKAHVVADRLSVLGAGLPDLATKAGLSADDVKALTIAGKKLGLFFGDMDEAGDGGKRDEAQAVFARYAEPLATIKAKAASVMR